MRIVTVITDPLNEGYAAMLKPSAQRNHLQLDTIQIDNYKTHRSKDEKLLNYLAGLDKDEIIFFTDGYDTLLLADEEEIIEKFNRSKNEMLFSAEIVCWPDAELMDEYPLSSGPFRFLNSGGFIGRAGYIRERIRENLQTESINKYYWSNQIYWTEQYLRHKDEIGIDTECSIFCTMVSKEDIGIGKAFLNNIEMLYNSKLFRDLRDLTQFHIENSCQHGSFDLDKYCLLKRKWFEENFIIKSGRLCFRLTKNLPCHIHFNGGSKVLAPHILGELTLESALKFC